MLRSHVKRAKTHSASAGYTQPNELSAALDQRERPEVKFPLGYWLTSTSFHTTLSAGLIPDKPREVKSWPGFTMPWIRFFPRQGAYCRAQFGCKCTRGNPSQPSKGHTAPLTHLPFLWHCQQRQILSTLITEDQNWPTFGSPTELCKANARKGSKRAGLYKVVVMNQHVLPSADAGMQPGKHTAHCPEEGAGSRPTQDHSGFYRWLKSHESSVCYMH